MLHTYKRCDIIRMIKCNTIIFRIKKYILQRILIVKCDNCRAEVLGGLRFCLSIGERIIGMIDVFNDYETQNLILIAEYEKEVGD